MAWNSSAPIRPSLSSSAAQRKALVSVSVRARAPGQNRCRKNLSSSSSIKPLLSLSRMEKTFFTSAGLFLERPQSWKNFLGQKESGAWQSLIALSMASAERIDVRDIFPCGESSSGRREVMLQSVVRLCGDWRPSTWDLYRSDYSDNGDRLSYLSVDQILQSPTPDPISLLTN